MNKMKNKKVLAIIEASDTGFGIYSDNLPGITGYGNTIDIAKKDLESAIEDVMESYKEDGLKPPEWLNEGMLDFVYKYDLVSLFESFGVFDVSALAKKIGINPSLLRQYKSGITTSISQKQKDKIQEGLHNLGRELLNVRL